MHLNSLLAASSLLLLALPRAVLAAGDDDDGYIGYHLTQFGERDGSAVYETRDTLAPADADPDDPVPDVFLNASVSVGEIYIEVDNLEAKVNLQAQVLSLLNFNAGVTASIDKVSLLIANVTAKVTLEARLANLVLMVDDVLNSIDLNPIIATLGSDVTGLLNDTVGGVTGALGVGNTGSGGTTTTTPAGTNGTTNGTISSRGLPFDIAQNIIYSVNDYSGNTHTNRILEQDGSIVQQTLNNDGIVSSQKIVGNYLQNMTFTGFNVTGMRNGQVVHELEYAYNPFPGFMSIVAIVEDTTGKVVAAQVLSESSAGGSSTISGDGTD